MRPPSSLPRIAARAALLALLAAPTPLSRARAEHPALSREFSTDSYARDPGSIEAMRTTRGYAGSVAISWLSVADRPGTGDPLLGKGEGGARGALRLLLGRCEVAVDATDDGDGNVDSREYPMRLVAGALVPEAFLSARAVAGFDSEGYGGADLELEFAPLPIPVPGIAADLRPELCTWVRGRKFDFESDPILNPAAGLVIQHLPLIASRVALAVTAQTDWARGNAPPSFGMVQLRWLSASAASGATFDPDLPPPPGAAPPSAQEHRFFVALAYAFPLDDRHFARVCLQGGLRFSAPLGGPVGGH